MWAQGASPAPGVAVGLSCKSFPAGVLWCPTASLKHVVSQNKLAKHGHNSQMARGGEL